MSKFLMFGPLGGGEANTRFCLCSVNPRHSSSLLAILGKSISGLERSFLQLLSAPAVFQVSQKGLSMFSTGCAGSSSPVPLVGPAQARMFQSIAKQLLDPSSLWLQGLPHRLYFWRPCTKRCSRATFLPVSSTLGV